MPQQSSTGINLDDIFLFAARYCARHVGQPLVRDVGDSFAVRRKYGEAFRKSVARELLRARSSQQPNLVVIDAEIGVGGVTSLKEKECN